MNVTRTLLRKNSFYKMVVFFVPEKVVAMVYYLKMNREKSYVTGQEVAVV